MAQLPEIILIDGTSYIFRAFHALPPLTSSSGAPTGALYGFCAMIHKLLQDYPQIPMVFFFDAGGKNWRHERYSGYKAHRTAPPDELIAQIESLKEVLPAFGMPIVQQHGIEADDLIAVVARRYSEKGLVLISSPDKDFTQIVSKNIILEQSLDSKRYDLQAVEEKYGLPQSQIIDYFSLIGDASDGIPGVPKIGPKTAVKLLKEHGSLDALLESADAVPGAVGRSLQENIDNARMSRELFVFGTEQQTGWPAELSAEELPPPPQPDLTALLSFYQKYELKTLFPRVKARPVYQPISLSEESVVDPRKWDQPVAVLSTEHGVAWAFSQTKAYYLPQECAQPLWEKLTQAQVPVIVADITELRKKLSGPLALLEDLSLIAYLLVADQRTNWDSIKSRLFSERAEAQHWAEEAAWLWQAHAQLSQQLTEPMKKLLVEVDTPLAEVLYQMQTAGICLDTQKLLDLNQQWQQELMAIKAQITELTGEDFNINSSKQLREVLFEKLQLTSKKKTPKGELSTKEDVLLAIQDQHPCIGQILAHRHLEKLRTTYTTSLVDQVDGQTGRLHTTFDQKGTVTGRLASSKPNLQNIPVKSANGRLIRQAFCAAPGKVLVFFDYSQIELRLMAHFSQDLRLLEAYQQGEDIHRQTAMRVLGLAESEIGAQQRQIAKTVNFGLLYGMSAYGLSQQLQIPIGRAQEFIDTYFEQFPMVRGYMQSMREFAQQHGYVETLWGRQIPIRTEGRRGSQEHAWRAAINGPLQGTASDLIKKAMIDLQPLLQENPQTQMLLQVHDELIFETPQGHEGALIEQVRPVMEAAMHLDVPLVVEAKTGMRWE